MRVNKLLINCQRELQKKEKEGIDWRERENAN